MKIRRSELRKRAAWNNGQPLYKAWLAARALYEELLQLRQPGNERYEYMFKYVDYKYVFPRSVVSAYFKGETTIEEAVHALLEAKCDKKAVKAHIIGAQPNVKRKARK